MERNYVLNDKGLEKMRNMAVDANVCILLTTGEDNQLNKRPMGGIKIDDEGNLWFFVSKSSGKLKDISANGNISVVFANADTEDYMEVQGTCEVNCEREEIINKWCPLVSQWFPGGFSDLEVCLVKLFATRLFYWDAEREKLQVVAIKDIYELHESLAA